MRARQASMVAIVALLLLIVAAASARADGIELVWGAGDIDLALQTSWPIIGEDDWTVYADAMYSPGGGQFAVGLSGDWAPIRPTRIGVGGSTGGTVFIYLVRGGL